MCSFNIYFILPVIQCHKLRFDFSLGGRGLYTHLCACMYVWQGETEVYLKIERASTTPEIHIDKYHPILQPSSFSHITVKCPHHTTTQNKIYVEKDFSSWVVLCMSMYIFMFWYASVCIYANICKYI